jgi:hypothetical protein
MKLIFGDQESINHKKYAESVLEDESLLKTYIVVRETTTTVIEEAEVQAGTEEEAIEIAEDGDCTWAVTDEDVYSPKVTDVVLKEHPKEKPIPQEESTLC